MDKFKFICGICNKAFTKHSSLKRHKTNQHMGITFNCINCNKSYKRREDLSRHTKKCLEQSQHNDQENSPTQPPVFTTSTSQSPSTSQSRNPANIQDAPTMDITNVHMDLTLSDSENEDEPLTKTIVKVENDLLCIRMSRETNTQISCLEMVDKATNTEPLIILSPDEVVAFQDGLTIASFKESLNIFIETLNSDIIYCKPRLSRPSTPTTQIGLLNCQAGYSRGNQTPKEARDGPLDPNDAKPILNGSPNHKDAIGHQTPTSMDILTSLFKKVSSSKHEPTKTHASIETLTQDNPPAAPICDVNDSEPSTSGSSAVTTTPRISTRILPGTTPEQESDLITQMCSRKPTRPSLFVPPCKRAKIIIPNID